MLNDRIRRGPIGQPSHSASHCRDALPRASSSQWKQCVHAHQESSHNAAHSGDDGSSRERERGGDRGLGQRVSSVFDEPCRPEGEGHRIRRGDAQTCHGSTFGSRRFFTSAELFDATGLLNQVFEKYLNAERGLFQLSQQFVADYGAVPKEVVNKLSQARLELFGKVVQCFEARVKSERRTLNILQARMAANGEPLPEQMLSAMRRICGDRRRGHPGTWRRDRMIAMVIRDVVAEFSCSDRRAASVVSAALERLKWPVTEPAVRQIWRNFRRPRVPAKRPRG